jgi:arrestin-related trafficking adapter 3/6
MTEVEHQRSSSWISTSHNGAVYYSTRTDRRLAADRFPTPLIRARQRRPHSIHIVSYPSGFIPSDLSPTLESKKKRKEQKKKQKQKQEEKEKEKDRQQDWTVVRKLLSSFASQRATGPTSTAQSRPESRSSASNFIRRLSIYRLEDLVNEEAMTRSTAMADIGRPALGSYQQSNRNSMISMRTGKSTISSMVTELPKPLASGSGVSCNILLAEPNVFLCGFDHEGYRRQESQGSSALLRGRLVLRVTKNVKIKAVELRLLGKARTEWPEGIPPLKTEVFQEESLRTQVLTFFNAMSDAALTGYGNQCTYTLKNSSESANSSSTNLAAPSPRHSINMAPQQSLLPMSVGRGLTAKDLKRLSLQNAQSRSFGKGDSQAASSPQAKGYKVFYPGTYEYSFELPIDHHQLETTKLQYGSVKWELHATIERAGAFKPNLHGVKEVSVVRVPDQLSLETSEPISISRKWEDQLHYDIIVSGKSFPLGTKIPIAFKLTPLAKVQVHKLKVFVTESIEYWTNNRRVTRKEPARKILLLEKNAGQPLDPIYEASGLRVVSGGELSPQQRREAREAATRRRAAEASRGSAAPQALPEPSDNILGDLDLGLESYWGSTEIEMNVQLPTCELMAKNKELRLHPDCSWKNVNVFHWIKVSF